MSATRTAFLVWTGAYSDAAVVAVCSTEEKAKAIVEWILSHDVHGRTKAEADAAGEDWYCIDSDAHVETQTMDPDVPGTGSRAPWEVQFRGSEVISVSRTQYRAYDVFRSMFYGPWKDGRSSADVLATDEAHAVKIACDLRTQHLALGRPS